MATALTPTRIDVLLRAANSSNLPNDIPWWGVKFSLNGAGIDPTTVDENKATGLVRNIRRVVEEERKDGMREASKEHIGALLALASGQEIPNDTTWEQLKFCLTCRNDNIGIPDSANWLRSFTRFRRTIAGEEVEPDHSQHAPQPSPFASPPSDSAYDSRHSESDLDCINVFLDNCENYRNGILSLFIAFPNITKNTTSWRQLLDALFAAERKRASVATLSSESGRRRDHSRSVDKFGEYLEDDDKATSTAIGFALQDPKVLNYSEAQITTLGKQAQLAIEVARKARRR
ncbi:hypothetical protein VTL71DRAFT_13050 [Oculimacula yallundae]|uniref:Uncharacterized protein n=1 Tax=Oculimacula yallundae TaxID=86028 RepID=A0ABR4CPQ1_9HELO